MCFAFDRYADRGDVIIGLAKDWIELDSCWLVAFVELLLECHLKVPLLVVNIFIAL